MSPAGEERQKVTGDGASGLKALERLRPQDRPALLTPTPTQEQQGKELTVSVCK